MQTPIKRLGLTSILILLMIIPFSLAQPATGTATSYEAFVILGLGLCFFIIYLANNINFGEITLGTKEGKQTHFQALKWFFLGVAGWLAVAVADIGVAMVETEAPLFDRFTGITNGIFTGATYCMIFFTFAYGLVLMYWIFMQFKGFFGGYR